MKRVVVVLRRARHAGGSAADQQGCAKGDDRFGPPGVQVGAVRENVVKMKKPHADTLGHRRPAEGGGPGWVFLTLTK